MLCTKVTTKGPHAANPDIGLTAFLTPHGWPVPLAVESLTTTELVVRAPASAPSDLEFDYIVYGLRIGFEETSVVQQKTHESPIPSMKQHQDRYREHPELRHFNALERYKEMPSGAAGSADRDFGRAKALHDAVGEHDPAQSSMRMRPATESRPEGALRLPGASESAPVVGIAPAPAAATSQPSPPGVLAWRVFVSGASLGDVLVADPDQPGQMHPHPALKFGHSPRHRHAPLDGQPAQLRSGASSTEPLPPVNS